MNVLLRYSRAIRNSGVIVFCLLWAGLAQAFTVDHVGTGTAATNLIADRLLGGAADPGITVSNLTIERGRTSNTSSNSRQLGYFNEGQGPLGISEGVLFTTGRVSDVTRTAPDGSNGNNRADYQNGTTNNGSWLTQYVEARAYRDPVVVSFDIVPERDTLNMQMVFSSEEYPDYACSDYNDGFAVFITGGEFGTTPKNIAIDPASQSEISINNINGSLIGEPNLANDTCGSPASYRPNATSTELAFNGMTVPITIAESVTPGQTYRVSIQIADAADARYDSAGFFGFLSSSWSAEADLSLSLASDVNVAELGETVNLTLTVTNDGPDDAFGVSVDAPFPANLTFDSAAGDGLYSEATELWNISHLPAGESRSIVLTGSAVALGSEAMFSEIATATGSDPDSTAGNGAQDPAEDDEATLDVLVAEVCTSTGQGGLASGGSGPYRDAVYWLDWGCQGKSTFGTSDVIRKSWIFGPVEVRATVSELSAAIRPYSTGEWQGDLLDDLYSGVNPIGLSNVAGDNPSFRIDWEVYLEGVRVPAEIIIADAEDTDDGESMVAETNGDPWELFAVAPGTNDLQMRFENGGTRMLTSSLPGDGVGSFLAMTQGITTSRHTLNTSGGQAVAFGVFVQKDHGDIAGGYPESGGHFASQVAQDGGKPTSNTDINNIPLATLVAPRPYLGVIPPGPEDADQNSANADADGPEEDGVTFSPLVPGSNATLDIVVTENTTGQGYLQGWIDWNRDDDLGGTGEQVALNVRDNGPEDANPAVGEIRLNVFVPPGAFVGDTYARFRFSNTPDVPVGGMLVMGGEVEDYKVTLAPAATAGPLSGWVFEDNGIGATAHDGLKGNDEPGLANVPVTLYHDVDNNGECSDTDPVLASTVTDGDGAWQLVAALADVGKNACLVTTTPNGLLSVSENSGAAGAGIDTGAANDDVMILTVPTTGTVWDGILFGDAGLPVLEPDQQGVVAPGGSRFYSHRFTARSAGSVDFSLEAATTSPAAPAWNDTLYRDNNCNGELDGADATLPLTAVNVQAGDQRCLLVKVFAPAGAPVEALHSRPLAALQNYTGTAFQATARVTDTTRVAAGQLQLEKQVRNIGPDGVANSGDDVDMADTTANQAAPGDVVRYRLTFRNQGSNALTEVVITDSTPAYSALNAPAACPASLPVALTACALSAPDGSNGSGYQGGLEWQFTGELQPGAQGAVSYDVRVGED